MPERTTVGLWREARRLKLDTLVRLRWLAVIGQCLTVSIVHFGLHFRLPYAVCLIIISVAAAVNVWLRIQGPASQRLGDDAATLLLGFDILHLATLIFLTGGLQNPFSILFLAPVLISAAVLPPQRTAALGLLAIGCASLLVLVHRPLPWRDGETLELPFLYVSGIWTSILLGIAFTGAFAYRVAEEARQLAAALAATELVLAREQHLTQLDGLAAAAAHELGTPLNTIALVAKDLDTQAVPGTAMAEDTRLLREQVERCRLILSKLTSLSNDSEGFFGTMSLSHLIEEVAEPQRSFDIAINISCSGDGPEPACGRSPGLLYGIGNLIENAVDFAESAVTITALWTREQVSVEIADDGPGFASEVLLHIGEPYVTTRSARETNGDTATGLGLGLFIAKTLIERSGATIAMTNTMPPAHGAIVRIIWPRALFEAQQYV